MLGHRTSHCAPSTSLHTHQDYFHPGGLSLRETSLWEERAGVTEPPPAKFLDAASASAPALCAHRHQVRVGQAQRVGLGQRQRQ